MNQARKSTVPGFVKVKEEWIIARLESAGFARHFWGVTGGLIEKELGWVDHVHQAKRYEKRDEADRIAVGLAVSGDWVEVWSVLG